MVSIAPTRFGACLLFGKYLGARLGGSSIELPDTGLEVCQPELLTADNHIRQNELQPAAQEAVLPLVRLLRLITQFFQQRHEIRHETARAPH